MQTYVKAATLNIHGRRERWPERRHTLVGQLIEARAELIAFQEVNTTMGQGKWICNQINARLTGSDKAPYHVVSKRYGRSLRGFSHGVAILSRLPMLYHESLNLGYGGCVALRAHVELPSHQTMDFVSVQLHHVPYDHEARHEQALKLMSWLHGHKRVPLQIVAGDMNEGPDGLAVAHIKQSFHSAYERVYGREPLATFPTALTSIPAKIGRCLDYLFISPAVKRVADIGIFCDEGTSEDNTLYPSDHVGLLATFEV